VKKLLIYLCVLAVCSVVLAEEKKAQEQEKEKPDYRNVIVDAWLVKVDADALYKSGVKPLSEKDKENVSIMSLLWCLGEPNSGEVIVSARTRSVVKNEVENSFDNDIYISESTEVTLPDAKPVTQRTHHPYGQKVSFKTYSNILENKQIIIGWEFFSQFIYNKFQNKYPPDTGSINYRNPSTLIPAQKLAIVAQSQIGKDMFFLVLRAEIVD
jgi:hypothetical protein